MSMTMATRTEKDSLGTMEVPADALYGAQTQRAVLNFPISGLKQYPAFIWSLALIKRAAADVNMDRACRAGGARGQAERPVRGGSVSGRRGHKPQHERQRGDCQPG
jgi:hypothetical protein